MKVGAPSLTARFWTVKSGIAVPCIYGFATGTGALAPLRSGLDSGSMAQT
jgi:hypothetical protein